MICTTDGVRGDFLRPPHGKTPAAVIEIKINVRSFKSSEQINEKGDGPYRGFSYSTVQGDFHQPAHPRGRFLRAPRNPAHLSAYNPTAEYFNPAADCGGSAEDPPVTCIIPSRVCGGFPMKSNDVIMIDRYSYAKTKGTCNTKCTCSALHLDFI